MANKLPFCFIRKKTEFVKVHEVPSAFNIIVVAEAAVIFAG